MGDFGLSTKFYVSFWGCFGYINDQIAADAQRGSLTLPMLRISLYSRFTRKIHLRQVAELRYILYSAFAQFTRGFGNGFPFSWSEQRLIAFRISPAAHSYLFMVISRNSSDTDAATKSHARVAENPKIWYNRVQLRGHRACVSHRSLRPSQKNHFQKHFGGTDMKPIQHPERHLARRYDCVTRSKEFQQAVHGNYVEDPTPVYNRLRELEQA